MSIRYSIKLHGVAQAISNLDPACAGCSETCVRDSEIVLCHATSERRRRAVTSTSLGTLYLCSNETVKSARLFREKIRALTEVIPLIAETKEAAIRDSSDHVHRLVHNLVTLNARTIQTVYRAVPQDIFGERDRESLIAAVASRLSDPEQTALLVISLLKNATLEKTEFDVFSKLHEQEPVSLSRYHIHKIFMLVLSTYWDALREKEVYVQVGKCQDRVYVDRDTIAASLVHLLDNAVKYILPKSVLKVSFDSDEERVRLVLDMVSLRIHPHEFSKIGREGFSGSEPNKIDRQGEGRGLFLVNELLALSDSSLTVEYDCKKDLRVHRVGIDFENNRFSVSMPRGKQGSRIRTGH